MSLLFCFWEEEFFSSSDTRLNSRGNGAFHGIHDNRMIKLRGTEIACTDGLLKLEKSVRKVFMTVSHFLENNYPERRSMTL